MSPETQTAPAGLVAGKKYRFVVASAEEAIRTVRERMGTQGRVLSVKQVDGRGLGRFLSTPKLEIVATIPSGDEARPPPPLSPPPRSAGAPTGIGAPAGTEGRAGAAVGGGIDFRSDEPATPASPRIESESESGAGAGERWPGAPDGAGDAPPAPADPHPGGGTGTGLSGDLRTLLGKLGFDATTLAGFEQSPGWQHLQEKSLPTALADVGRRLRSSYREVNGERPVSGRVAFLGTPGCGKTTALCKRLANDVILQRRPSQVLKLEGENPNSDDSLRLFCEVLGVPFHRDPGAAVAAVEEDPDGSGGGRLYIDLPGVREDEQEDWWPLLRSLEELRVGTRVLVVNAAYEADLIKESFSFGHRLAATHVVFSHLDELPRCAKLWPFVLRGGLQPWFFSHGQNVTSDFSEDVLDYLLGATFPRRLLT